MNEQERIQEIKRLKEEIDRLQEQLIDFELPKNYDKMTEDEKKAYHKKQKKLIEAALSNIENYSDVTNNTTKFSYPKLKSNVVKFAREVGPFKPLEIVYDSVKKTYKQETKDAHKKQLEEIENTIDRYNSTKAIRNDRIEFGVNFSNFASTYFSLQACQTLDRLANKIFLEKFGRQKDKNGKVIVSGFKIQELTDDQRKELIKIRIKLFAQKLNKLFDIAQKKVNKDNRRAKTYLEKNGFIFNQTSYKNGTKKFSGVRSTINKFGIDMSKTKRLKSHINSVNGYSKENRYEKAQHDLIELNVSKEKFETFVKNYRGNGRQFSVEFQQNFPALAEKIYNKSNGVDSLSFSTLNLASSPISVQEHEISKKIEEEIKKTNYRMQYRTYFIPSAQSNTTSFLGKNFTNKKTQTEKKLDELKVQQYQKDLKSISLKQDLTGYETIFDGLNTSIKNKFNKHKEKNISDFDKLSEKRKTEELKNYIISEINTLKRTTKRNSFFSGGLDKLLKLNGILIDKNQHSKVNEDKDLLEKLNIADAEVYRNLTNDIKDTISRVNQEKGVINELEQSLEKLNSEPFSFEINNKINAVMKDLNSHTKKLAIINSTLQGLEEKKKDFEKGFASVQIDKAITENKNLTYNTSKSVFDKYRFPAVDAFGESYDIEIGSVEAKQIEKIIGNFIMKFKNQIQNMKLSFEKVSVAEISDFIVRLSGKLSDDFGSNIRDLKKAQKFFKTQIESLKNSKNNSLVTDLENYLQRLNVIESELIKKLKSMNVEIGNVTLIKK